MFPTRKINQQFIDIEIIKQDITNQKYTDCKIIIVDQERSSIEMCCHKIILYSASEYFRNAFSCGDTDHIIIKARDARIMQDVVMSLYNTSNTTDHYGYPEWEYLLQTFMCKNYLLLNNDETLLYNVKVPEHGFELLMQVLVFYNLEKNLQLRSVARENLPTHYNLPDYLRNVITKHNTIILCGPNKIDTWNIENKELLNSFNHDGYIASVSFDGKLYVTVDAESIKLWNNYGGLIREIKHNYANIFCISISYNNKFFVLHDSNAMIHIISTEDGQLIRTVNDHSRFLRTCDTIAISHDDQKIAYVTNNNDIHIQNVRNGQLIHNLIEFAQHPGAAHCIAFTSDDKFVVASCFDKINIWDTENGLLIRTLNKLYPVWRLIMSYNDRYMVMNSSSRNHIEVWDTVDQLPILIHKRNIQFGHQHISISNDNKLIAYQNADGIDIYYVKGGELVTALPFDNLSCIRFV